MAWDRLTVDPLGFFGIKLSERGTVHNLTLGFGQRFALLGGHDGGQIILVFHHQIKPAPQHNGAFLGRALGPALHGFCRAGNGLFGLLCAKPRHSGDDFPGRRIGDLSRIGPANPFAGN